MFGASKPAGGGLFGNQPQNNTQASTPFGSGASTGSGLFGGGQSQQGTASTGLFGKPAQTTASPFGQPQQNSGSSLFGSSQPSQPSLFGQNSQPQQQQGGLFGQNNQQQAQPQQQGSLFGNNSQTQGSSLFGNNTSSTTQSGGLFGNANNANNNTQSGGLFGQGAQQQQQQPQQSGSLFGQSNNNAQGSGGLFGASKPLFGGTTTSNAVAPANNSAAPFSLTTQQQQQQQQQPQSQLPAITPFTRPGDLPEQFQKELEKMETYIRGQQQLSADLRQATIDHRELVESIPSDVQLLRFKLTSAKETLRFDDEQLAKLKGSVDQGYSEGELLADVINQPRKYDRLLPYFYKKIDCENRLEQLSLAMRDVQQVLTAEEFGKRVTYGPKGVAALPGALKEEHLYFMSLSDRVAELNRHIKENKETGDLEEIRL